MTEENEKLYTRLNVASILSVHERTVDRIIKAYNLPIVRIGNLVRIPKKTLDALIEKLTVKAAE